MTHQYPAVTRAGAEEPEGAGCRVPYIPEEEDAVFSRFSTGKGQRASRASATGAPSAQVASPGLQPETRTSTAPFVYGSDVIGAGPL